MSTIRTQIAWRGGNIFEGGGVGGPAIRIQAGASDGPRQGPRPKELALLGLSSCSAIDVVDILKKMRQPLASLEVRVEADVAEEHPKRLLQGVLHYAATGEGLDPAKVVRAAQLSLEKYCGVAATYSGRMALRFAVEVNGIAVLEDTLAAVP